ncbi:ribosome silencing factor [Hippea jasoniae]|uniref:ribosome silencing factor n=1 Tax=Hippea jasoniae TaxID=944479 RepID=UPI00054F0DFA|nr:ribosome silencing factor [Hippea jasoniae]
MRDRIVEILEDKKATDIVSIDMRMRSSLFDFFIIATIESDKQVYAIYDEIKKSGIDIHHLEESKDGSWTVIDCFDVIVHLFSPSKRKEYDIESLWDKTIQQRLSSG